LGQYKGLKVAKADASVSADDVDADIKTAQNRAARKVEAKDRKVKNGDFVTLDYSGSTGGVKFKGGTAEKQELEIGSNSFIPGFEEQVIGMEIGGEKDLNVKFPDEYHAKELAGKDAVFAVKVHEIKVKELPKLDDEFAKDVSTFDTFKEYKDDVKRKLEESKQKRADQEDENTLVQEIVKLSTADVPQCMVDTQLDYMLREFEYRLMYQGMKLADYFKYTKTTKEDFLKDRADEAKNTVKTRLVIEAIVKAEDMKVEDSEAEFKIAELAAKAEKSAADYKKENARQLEQIKNEILSDKLIKFLKDNNTFVKETAGKKKNNEK
jgi:trigger factor